MKLGNIEERLKGNLSITELLNIIKQSNNEFSISGNRYIIVTRSLLSQVSTSAAGTIDYCAKHKLIDVIPAGRKSFEYYLTEKGLDFLKKNT